MPFCAGSPFLNQSPALEICFLIAKPGNRPEASIAWLRSVEAEALSGALRCGWVFRIVFFGGIAG